MSAVWKYFEVWDQDSKVAVCIACKVHVMRGGARQHSFNTTNLIVHLKNRHPDDYKEFLRIKNDKTSAQGKTHQQPILQSFEKARKYSSDHPKVKELNRKIIEFIALDNQPFTVVEDTGFRRLLMHLEPRYAMPSRRYFSDVALPELQSFVSSHVEKLLAKAKHISFTTDIWTSSVAPVSMLSLTAQWIDEDFILKKAVLHSQECPGSHTAAAIAAAFDNMLQTWKIEKENVHVVLRDNARNIAKAMTDFGVPSVACMAHTLQLAVHEGVLSQRSIGDAVAVGRKIVGHLKHSQVACNRLQGVQRELGMPVKRLQQDIATRWNSTFYMMQSLVEQKRALSAYAADFELPATLTANQWGILQNMISLLAPFEQLTREISNAEASAADVIPAIVALPRLLSRPSDTDRGVQTAKTTLLEAVRDRFSGVQSEPLYSIATMLDPRHKDRYFETDKKRDARNLLLKVVDELEDVKMEDASTQVSTQTSTHASAHARTEDPPEKRIRMGSLLDMYEEILEESIMLEEQENTETASQVNGYLSEATVSRKESPLEYWKINQARFPALACAARKYLSAPSTSVDSERLFSTASDVLDEKRNRLDCGKAEMLLFVQKNLPLLQKK